MSTYTDTRHHGASLANNRAGNLLHATDQSRAAVHARCREPGAVSDIFFFFFKLLLGFSNK
jgi:hypothetical protein